MAKLFKDNAIGISASGGTTDNTSDTYIPFKDGTAFDNSHVRNLADRVVFDVTAEFPPGSAQIGQGMKLSAAGGLAIFRSLLTGNSYSAIYSQYDDTGSQIPFYVDFESEIFLEIQSDFSTSTPLSGTFPITAQADVMINKFVLKTNASATLTNVRLNFVSQATGESIYYYPSRIGWEADEGSDLVADGSGNIEIDITEAPILAIEGAVVDVSYEIDSGTLLGTGTVPYSAVYRQVGTLTDIASQPTIDAADRVQTTGLLEGGIISAPTSTTVSWTSGRGIVANYADPENPVITDVTWDAESGIIPAHIETDGTTMFGYDAVGSFEQRLSTGVSIEDAHNIIWFGSATHIDDEIVAVITAPGNLGYDAPGSYNDFINLVIGPANVDGNVYDANGANMDIDVIGGNAFMIGSNFRISPALSDIITLASESPVTFQKVYRSAGAGLNVLYDGAATTTIDPSQYDDGTGTLATTTAGYWTIQRIFRSRTGHTYVAYGQEEFASKSAALAVLGKEPFTEKSPLPFMLYRCSLLVVQGASDLSDTDEAEFHTQSAFRLDGAQSSSASIPGVTNPGGPDTSIQYNSGGSFGGDANLTYNSTTKEFELTGFLNAYGPQGDTTSFIAGNAAGEDITTATNMVIIGDDAGGQLVDGINSVYIGSQAGNSTALTTGSTNTIVGARALTNTTYNNSNVTAIGYEAAAGSDNIYASTIVGSLAGKGSTGTKGVYLGHTAGETETRNNILWISNSSNDLITGDFWNQYVDVLGDLGVGVGVGTPSSPLHVYENTSSTGVTAGVTIEQTGTGDSLVHHVAGSENITTGIDQSTANYIVSQGADLSTPLLTIDDGRFNGAFIDIDNDVTSPAGNRGGIRLKNFDETDGCYTAIWNQANGISSGINFVNSTYASNYGHMLFQARDATSWHNYAMSVHGHGVGIDKETPVSRLHVNEYTTATDDTNGITIEQAFTGDCALQWKRSGAGQRWSAGIAADDTNFRIANDSDLETNTVFEIDTSGNVTATDFITGSGSVVVGPTSSTDLSICTYDGTTGKLIQNNSTTTLFTGLSEAIFKMNASGLNGDAFIRMGNYAGTSLLQLHADSASDAVSIQTLSNAASFNISNLATNVDTNIAVTGNASVDLRSTGANTNPPMVVASTGTDGAVVQFFTSTVNPEGVITANPGDICYFKNGASSRVFQLEAASAGNTGWVSQEGGNVSGATTTVVNTIPTWGDTTGSSLLANDTAFLTTSGSATDFILESPSATGLAGMSLKDSSDSLQLTVEYAESADRSQILDYSGSGLDFGSDVGLMSCRSTSATDMFVDIETPDPFSGGSGLRVKASGGSNKVELLYDEAADESLLRDQSTAGLEIATDARVLIESTADHDAELMTWGTTGTSGSAFDIHVGNQDPNTIVTGSGGDMYHSVTGATSAIYCHDGASPSNNDWKPLLKGPSSATTAKSLAYFTDTSGTNVDSHPQMTLWDGLDHINLNLFGADTAATAQIGCWDSTESIGSFLNWVGVSEFGELDINESGIHAKSGVNDSFLNVASKSVSGSAVIRLIDSSDDDKFILQYAESTGTLQMDATEDLKFNMSSGAGVNIVTASPNTKAPLALETSGTGGASNSIFLSDVTPVGAITGSPGDACFKADDGIDSNMYIHKGTGSDNTGWERVHTGRLPIFKSYSIGTVKERGVHYYAGFYDASEDDTTLTIGGTTTETYGDSNRAEGAHAFCVASGAGGTDLVLTVSGTSITDAGVRTTSDSEVIVSDADAATTDQYFETTKKWLGIVTYTLTGASGSFTFNYGFAKYEDFNNKDFDTEGIEFVCLANKATTVDIEYLYHSDQGWTYSSDSFIPGGNTICSLSTDYSTDNNIDVDAYAAYKRSNLTQEVEGTSLEGVLIRLTTVTGDAITRGDIHLLVNADII